MARLLIDRRQFLASAGLAFAASLTPKSAEALARSDAVFAIASREPSGAYALALMTEDGRPVSRDVLPGRAHGLAVSPRDGTIVAFARRPGTFFAAFGPDGRSTVTHAAEGRHFFGHGTFSADGLLLYASENDFDNQRGVIGLYDATGSFRRIGEFDAFGIGTHDLAPAGDGRHLVAANGGIATHPDFGRTKLNLDTMEPSVALIDARDGSLAARHVLTGPLRHVSTRHAEADGAGHVFIACQSEGPANERPPVIGRMDREGAVTWFDLPEEAATAMANYVGAIAVNRAAGLVAATSPRGGAYVILEAATGRLVRSGRLAATSALAPDRGGFVFASENGVFGDSHAALAFDQHMVRIGPAA